MSPDTSRFKIRVLLAAAVIIVLAGFLGARLIGRSSVGSGGVPVPGAGMVPAAVTFESKDLEVPCWSCPQAKE